MLHRDWPGSGPGSNHPFWETNNLPLCHLLLHVAASCTVLQLHPAGRRDELAARSGRNCRSGAGGSAQALNKMSSRERDSPQPPAVPHPDWHPHPDWDPPSSIDLPLGASGTSVKKALLPWKRDGSTVVRRMDPTRGATWEGSIVASDGPITLSSGPDCAQISPTCVKCDHATLEAQLLPICTVPEFHQHSAATQMQLPDRTSLSFLCLCCCGLVAHSLHVITGKAAPPMQPLSLEDPTHLYTLSLYVATETPSSFASSLPSEPRFIVSLLDKGGQCRGSLGDG